MESTRRRCRFLGTLAWGVIASAAFARSVTDRWTRQIDLISSGSIWHVLYLGLASRRSEKRPCAARSHVND